MTITCKEMHRLDGSTNIAVLDGDGNEIYNRYVDATKWDADPEAVTAEIADYLAKRVPPSEVVESVNKDAVVMTDQQVVAKLAEIEATKIAEEDPT